MEGGGGVDNYIEKRHKNQDSKGDTSRAVKLLERDEGR